MKGSRMAPIASWWSRGSAPSETWPNFDILWRNHKVFSMNVSLTTEMEQWVQQKVGSGLYSSAREVVKESLRALYASENQKSRGAQRVSPVCYGLLL